MLARAKAPSPSGQPSLASPAIVDVILLVMNLASSRSIAARRTPGRRAIRPGVRHGAGTALDSLHAGQRGSHSSGIPVSDWPGIWLLSSTPDIDIAGDGITILESRTRKEALRGMDPTTLGFGPPSGRTRWNPTKEVRLPDLRARDLALPHDDAIATSEGSGRSSLGSSRELSSVQVGALTATNALFRDSAEGSFQREVRAPTLGSYVSHMKELSKTW